MELGRGFTAGFSAVQGGDTTSLDLISKSQYTPQVEFGFHFLEVVGKRTHELTEELIKDRAYSILYARKFEEELENTLRTMRAEAFVEFKNLD